MLKKSRLTIIILSLLFTSTLYAQEESNLFTYSTVERNSLSNTANELLNKIESAKQVKSVRLIEIHELQSQSEKLSISVRLPNGDSFNFLKTSAKSIKEGYHYWKGVDEENSASFSLVISENDLTGMIRAKGIMFDIGPLQNTTYHILKEIDSSELDHELAPIEVENNNTDTSRKH
ncbi:hypothetical protein [Gracilimonas sp.]|uniref:hypothetical protein n=1 Tax=Gracilimonas sp. TaxID=1974203 RepID=UPI0032EDC2B4